jgi:6-phosphofructokinase 1
MAGYTGFSVGLVNHRIVYLPIPLLVATSPRNLRPDGQIWERVLAMTGQPMPEMATAAAEEGVLAVEEEEFPRLPEPTLH